MEFNTLQFAIFLPLVFMIYWAIPHKFRWAMLLVASYIFYMSWNAKYALIILFTTICSYLCARIMEKTQKKKLTLAVTLVISLGVLFVFKYVGFAGNILQDIFNMIHIPVEVPSFSLLLPVGISFYTFQTMSYVIDVYRGEMTAEKHFGKYAAYISFFPQLVAGPIERAKNLLPQFYEEKKFDYDKATYGLRQMAVGFFKKIVVADTFAVGVNAVFNQVKSFSGFVLLVASVMFTIQIYCDFSGYSDIAIGCARLLGFDLMENFHSPYLATSVKDFWRRWHISLSTWFRDYVYIPLGGNRKGKMRQKINLIITFLLSGLWHGANQTFVLWGGVHGLAQIVEQFFREHFEKIKIPKWISIPITFVFINFAWILFRANSLTDAIYIYSHMFVGFGNPMQYINNMKPYIRFSKIALVIIALEVIILLVIDLLNDKQNWTLKISKLKLPIKWCIYVLFVLMIVMCSYKGVTTPFIYFQF